MKINLNPGKLTFFFTVLFSFGFLISAQAQEKEISKNDLPKAVVSSFQKAYPHGVIKGASTEVENGKKYYEIESVEGKTRRDLLLLADGTITEIEETIPESELPSAVTKSLHKKFKSFNIERAEKVTSGKKVTYELAVESNDKDYEVVLNKSGKIVKTEKMNESGEKGESDENEENDND